MSSKLLPIHNCIQISLENEYFKEKLTEFYKENKKLKEELGKLTQQKPEETKPITKQTSHVSCQTTEIQKEPKEEPKGSLKCSLCKSEINEKDSKPPAKKSNNTFDTDFYNKQNKKSYVKLCEMQHNLLKKYEDEVNLNAVKQDLINKMKIELDQYEVKVKEYELQFSDLRSKAEELEKLETKQKSLLIDLETYKVKCQKYKEELKHFDDDFFDEIEKLKNKYDEAVKLNKYYEKFLSEKDLFYLIADNKQCAKKKNRVKFDLKKSEPEKSKKMKNFSIDIDRELENPDFIDYKKYDFSDSLGLDNIEEFNLDDLDKFY